MNGEMEQCIRNCLDCHRTCEQTLDYCIQMGGPHVEPRHVRTMRDCAQMCITSADFMLRGSQFHSRTCEVCAEICDSCAESCDALGDDTQMRQCADMCRRCADSCRQMAGIHMAM